MNTAIVPRREDFDKTLEKIVAAGAEHLHIIADFDRTLTFAHQLNGEFLPSVIAVLRNEHYLSKEYSSAAHALFDTYHPIEIDPLQSVEEKSQAMVTWWNKHFNLLMASGLHKDHLQRIIDSEIIRLREGAHDFFRLSYEKNIPFVIVSAQGVGNTIPMVLEKEEVLYPNVHVVTNLFEFGDDGKATKSPPYAIHSFNKGEVALEGMAFYDSIASRKNVFLLGDGLGDVDMIKGFSYENLLKFGFLNKEADTATRKAFEKAYDYIIPGDSDMESVVDFLKEVR